MIPPPPGIEDWNAAHYRLDDYLRAHGVRDRVWQSRLVLQILDEARVRHRSDPNQSPITHALNTADERMERWLRSVRDFEDLPSERLLSTGKLLLYCTNAIERWPDAFLSPDTPPPELREELAQISLVTRPVLEPASMVPREPNAPPVVLPTDRMAWSWVMGLVAGAGLATLGCLVALWRT